MIKFILYWRIQKLEILILKLKNNNKNDISYYGFCSFKNKINKDCNLKYLEMDLS